ncbi:lipocalin family protein [Aquimarina sp. 2201CG5-10]|uniref:lipocalin family protein n=1 Tax=Aquimarina callyspongiae TaxID=3098150 RepID=UPI002AB4B375|nr:lipocalin family protein [Aquimarina sp. 2201CG5-10]MDY8136110.1 lipocalin family protein [Aquimarina sp. 2201CG5-10]
MKKQYLIIFCLLVIVSCKPLSKTVVTAMAGIKGDWVLNTIDYEADGVYKITLFDQVPAKCLEKSHWKFISNNNTGKYTILDTSCKVNESQNFVWTIPDEMYGFDYSLMIKPVNKRMVSELNNKGYRMALSKLDKTTMIWTYEVMADNDKIVIELNFTKVLTN